MSTSTYRVEFDVLGRRRANLTPCTVSVPAGVQFPGSVLAKSIFEHVRAETDHNEVQVELDLATSTGTVFVSSGLSAARALASITIDEVRE
jgi:hypothetical protein